jgi:hypothetical protein
MASPQIDFRAQQSAIDPSSLVGRFRNQITQTVQGRIEQLYRPIDLPRRAIETLADLTTSDGAPLPPDEARKRLLDPWMYDFEQTHIQGGLAGGPFAENNLGGAPFWDINASGTVWTSLGRVLGFFFGIPLASDASKPDSPYDEVQFMWHCFSSDAAWYANQPICNFLIEKSELIGAMSELFGTYGMNVPVTRFLAKVNESIIRNPASKSFGFDRFYEPNSAPGEQPKRLEGYRENEAAFTIDKNELIQRSYTRFGAPTSQSPRFTLPRITITAKAVPKIRSRGTDDEVLLEEKGVCRVQISDSAANRWRGLASILQGVRLSAQPTLRGDLNRSASPDLDPLASQVVNFISDRSQSGLDVRVDEESGTFVFNGGLDRIKQLYAKVMPTLIYGGEGSLATRASFASNSNSQLANIQIIRNNTGAGISPAQSTASNMPMRVDPSRLTIEMLGNPLLDYGQVFFADFKTGTTVDNIYMMFDISHEITPGKFFTSVSGTPPSDAYAQFESALMHLTNALAVVNQSDEQRESGLSTPSDDVTVPEE